MTLYALIYCMRKMLPLNYSKKYVYSIFKKLQDFFGNQASRNLNSGQSFQYKFFSLILPRNEIHPVKDENFNRTELNYIFTKTKKVIASNSYDKSHLHVILLSPRNFGIHGNVIFDGLFDFLQNYGIRTSWFCANEFGINFKDELSQLIIESSETINTIVFIDPLAAVEFFARYRDLDANWFLSLQSKAHFTLAALLGDIWRPKDQISIFKFRDAVNVFFHMDEYSALKYSSDIYQKMFFYPLGAFSNISKEKTLMESKTDQVFFSGQIRDSDRRWWLVELSSLAIKQKFSLELNTWYKHKNAINRADYLKKLASSTSSFGLSQRGKNHWILPSRSIESLRLSTALIQQEGPDCSPASSFLKPYKDYLPFVSLQDLRDISISFLKDQQLLIEIGLNGKKALEEAFPSDMFFTKLINYSRN